MYEGKVLFVSPKGYGMLLDDKGDDINDKKIFAPRKLMTSFSAGQRVRFDCEPGVFNMIAIKIVAFDLITQPS